MNISPLLYKYVIFKDTYPKDFIIKNNKSNLFIVYDIIDDPNDSYKYVLQSVRIKKFEIWAKVGQIILLDDRAQVIARTLYGKI